MTKQLMSCVIVLGVAANGCAQLSPEMQVIHDAAEAMGGVETVEDATTLMTEGAGSNYWLGQNLHPDTEPLVSEVESYKSEVDLQNHRWRVEVTNANFMQTDMVTQARGLDQDVAFNVGGDGEPQRLGAQVARERHGEYYSNPLTILQAALAEGMATVSNLRQEMGHNVVDVTTADGSQLTLHVDAETHLPLSVSYMSYNTNLGDVAITTSFSDYADAGGVMLPEVISQTTDKYPRADLRVTNTVNGAVMDLAAPADVAAAAEPPPQANVTVEEVANGVWHLAGQSHHSVLIEFPEYTALVEAPQHDTRTLAVIEQARELVPDKPLQYLVNTHYHFDHAGGFRAAVAEGLTVITHEINRAHYEDLVTRPHTITEDHLAQNPAPLMIETVTGDEKYELRNGNRVAEIYRLQGSPHNDGLLAVYLPGEQILIAADIHANVTREDIARGHRQVGDASNVLQNIRDLGLRVDTIAPVHGMVGPLSALEQAVAAQEN